MKKLMEKLGNALIRAKLEANRFVNEEKGDTNFISIAIILVVVIVIAIVFITLGQDLGDKLSQKVSELMGALG